MILKVASNIKIYHGGVVALILSLIWLGIFYSEVIISPNHFWFDKGYDALRAYHVLQTMTRFEEFWFNSEMINFPFGENIFYLDCNPPVLWIVKILGLIFPGMKMYSLGIYNVILLITLPICTWFVYKIIVHYTHEGIWPGILAFSITVLCPQIFRWSGHPALGMFFFIPLTWYLCLQICKDKKRNIHFILLGISNFFWLLVHPYNGMMCLFFSFLFLAFYFLKNKLHLGLLIYAGSAVFVPFVLYYSLVYFTNHHTGRTMRPFGFFEFKAVWEGFVFPTQGPLHNALKECIDSKNLHYDAAIYLGLSTILICLFAIPVLIFKKQVSFIQHQSEWFAASIPVFVMLLFAFGFPFVFHHESLFRFPWIANLRFAARFAWPFWFFISVFAATFLLSIKKQNIQTLLITFFCLIQISEAIPFHQSLSKTMTENKNPYITPFEMPWKDSLCNQINAEKYTAVIPMPFFHIGSNNFFKDGDRAQRVAVMLFSYYTQIPLMTSPCIRVSENEARMHFELLSPSFYDKQMKNFLPPKAEYLIFKKTDAAFNEYENEFLSRANFVKGFDDFELYSVSAESLFKNTAAEEMANFTLRKTSLLQNKEGFLCTDTLAYFMFNDFETQPISHPLFGKGSLTGMKNEYQILASIEGGKLSENVTYRASMWINNTIDDGTNMLLVAEEKDTLTGNSEWISQANPAFSLVVNGNYTLAEIDFTPKIHGRRIYIFTKGYPFSYVPICIDNFMIREVGKDYYRYDSSRKILMKNNHLIKVEDKAD